MIRMEPNDVMYAGAGFLWGVITLVRGARTWQRNILAVGVTITLACAVYFLMAVNVHAEEAAAKPVDHKTYLETLQAKLDHVARRANQPGAGSSSVIGLRGSKQEPLSKQLYWKGKEEPQPVSPQEIKEFRAAVELAKDGQTTQATAALQTFLTTHPESPLKADAEETIKILSAAS